MAEVSEGGMQEGPQLGSGDEYDFDACTNTIFLTGEKSTGDGGIDAGVSTNFLKSLYLLDRKRELYINMAIGGGECEAGFAIYDLIKTWPSATTITAYTGPSSMSSIILQAATWRVLMPSTIMMVHGPNTQIMGQHNGIMSYMDISRQQTHMIVDIFAERMHNSPLSRFYKKSKKTCWAEASKMILSGNDFYFTAHQAVAWGLADEVYEGKK